MVIRLVLIVRKYHHSPLSSALNIVCCIVVNVPYISDLSLQNAIQRRESHHYEFVQCHHWQLTMQTLHYMLHNINDLLWFPNILEGLFL